MRLLALGAALLVLLAGCSSGGEDAPDGSDGTSGPAAPMPAEAGIATGRLTVLAPVADVEIPIKSAGHGRLAVALVMATPVPESGLAMVVTGPDGRQAEGETSPTLYALPGPKPTVSFGDPTVGTWTVRVELSGATADYEVHWCADDLDAKGPASNLACQRY